MPSGGGLGIRAGEVWAYRSSQRSPLAPAKIIEVGSHYDAPIRIRLVDDTTLRELWVRRAKLPCQWSEAEAWLEAHPHAQPVRREPTSPPQAYDPVSLTLSALRRVVREEVERASGERKLAYSIEEFAAATGYGRTTIDRAIARGELVASYANTKGVIDIDEGKRWIKSLSHEPPD